MTLDELWCRYKALYLGFMTAAYDPSPPEQVVANYEFYVRSGLPVRSSEGTACYHAAKLYLIARDEGMEAAMLWKLAQP